MNTKNISKAMDFVFCILFFGFFYKAAITLVEIAVTSIVSLFSVIGTSIKALMTKRIE